MNGLQRDVYLALATNGIMLAPSGAKAEKLRLEKLQK